MRKLISRLWRSVSDAIARLGMANKGQVFGPNYVNMCSECNEWVDYGPLSPCGKGKVAPW